VRLARPEVVEVVWTRVRRVWPTPARRSDVGPDDVGVRDDVEDALSPVSRRDRDECGDDCQRPPIVITDGMFRTTARPSDGLIPRRSTTRMPGARFPGVCPFQYASRSVLYARTARNVGRSITLGFASGPTIRRRTMTYDRIAISPTYATKSISWANTLLTTTAVFSRVGSIAPSLIIHRQTEAPQIYCPFDTIYVSSPTLGCCSGGSRSGSSSRARIVSSDSRSRSSHSVWPISSQPGGTSRPRPVK
jgi:hypothetical protein